VTQPALSRAIGLLEAEVGGLLFRREGKLTHVTDLAELLKPRLEGIIRETLNAKHLARRFLTCSNAGIRLGVMCTIGPRLFARFLADLRTRHPGIHISVLEGVPGRLLEKLEAGELDIAITALQAAPLGGEGIEPLYRERFMIAFAPMHRFASMPAVPIKAMEGEHYLKRINCEFWDYLTAVCDQCGVYLPVVHASEREDWILNMVAAGFGICFLPEQSAIVPGVLTRPIVEPEVFRDIGIVRAPAARDTPAISSFAETAHDFDWTRPAEALRLVTQGS
jgi:DNA-binding transcriptional LysR family regulator